MKKLFLLRFSVAAFFCLLCVLPALAANIKVKGAVKDKLSKEPLIGATIRLIGTPAGAVTDMDGNFELNAAGVLEGMYDIEIKYVGYKTEVRRKVRVENGKLVILNLELETDAQELSDVVVVAKKNRENENMLLLEQQKAVIAVQSVGVKELSRKGVSDAEGAVTKVSGISKQDGVKNVFVRGLGDRYNTTTFNGFPVPSEDPEYKNISLDFFGTDIIQSVGVNKAFTAGGSGDVGGANIDIASKELVGSGYVSAGVSAGVNTQTMTADFLKPDGTNPFGFANRTQPSGNAWGFENKLDPAAQNFQIDRSYNISGGKRFYVGGERNVLSFFATAGHTTDYRYTDETIRNTTTDGTVYKDMTGHKSAVNISQLALANVDFDMQNRHHLAYNLMLVHNSTQSVGNYEGKNDTFSDDYGNQGMTRRQQVNDNLLIVNQLTSNWGLTDALSFDAGVSYNMVRGYEPDRRINEITKNDTGYGLVGGNTQFRTFAALTENDLNLRGGLVYRLKDSQEEISQLRIGYTGRIVNDDFEQTEYNLITLNGPSFTSLNDIALDDFYTSANFGTRFNVDNAVDKYTVKKNIHSVYAEAVYQFSSRWVANLGVKYDNVDMTVDYNVDKGNSKGKNSIRENYFLPSLNLRYNLTDKHTLRLGASKTYTLPQSKEISPYRYVGVNFKSQGNANLKPSDNYNLDLKWDFTPTPTELISLTAFYKMIKNPISRIETPSAGGFLSYENISGQATVAGIELEIRKNLLVRPAGKNGTNRLSAGLNGSYIYTNAKIDDPDIAATDKDGSQLEGAAPWIANFDLSHTYSTGRHSFTNTLVLGYVGEKVYTLGTQGYRNIMEEGVTTLDFVSQAKFGKHFLLSLKARNLLNPAYRLRREASGNNRKVVLGDYKKGINVSLGVSCTF